MTLKFQHECHVTQYGDYYKYSMSGLSTEKMSQTFYKSEMHVISIPHGLQCTR